MTAADDHTDMSRRRMLSLLGAAGVAAVTAACSSSKKVLDAVGSTSTSSSTPTSTSPSTSTAPASTAATAATTGATGTGAASCVLTPEMTEGPYYLAGEAIRSDITEGKPGAGLRLPLTVVDATTCKPIQGATVEIWHADASGEYSGFGGASGNRTFLRGGQVTDSTGTATFQTVYPGWYPGRTVHIHVKVHVGGNVVHTGQLFFDDSFTDDVYKQAPYMSRSGRRTLNTEDGIFSSGGVQSMLALKAAGDGSTGTITMGVRA